MLRDFTLKLRDKGKKISSKQYLENSLKQEGAFDDASMRQDQIRAMIKVCSFVFVEVILFRCGVCSRMLYC